MYSFFAGRRKAGGQIAGFTLIELLIVVAIIAILAAIAVPNFLEAQTRSKVSRCAADMRSIRVGIESYRVDANKYPDTDFKGNLDQPGAGLFRITTPQAYMTSVPKSPFKETNMGGVKWCNDLNIYLYVRAKVCTDSSGNTLPQTPAGTPPSFDQYYQQDRIRYIAQVGSIALQQAVREQGEWELKSVGPNNVDDFNTIGANCRVYDPTNGTISDGDVVVFSDSQGFAKPQ